MSRSLVPHSVLSPQSFCLCTVGAPRRISDRRGATHDPTQARFYLRCFGDLDRGICSEIDPERYAVARRLAFDSAQLPATTSNGTAARPDAAHKSGLSGHIS